jgi:cell division protein FtsL
MARAAAAAAAAPVRAGAAAPARAPRPARKPAPARPRPTRQRAAAEPRKVTGRSTRRKRSRAANRLPLGARLLDALLSGRAWIALVGVLLAGIVFFNVDLMRMNREITHMADRAATMKRENAGLRQDVAQLANSERIQEAAAQLGLVLPQPDQVRYLRSNPRIDARNASKRIIAPNPIAAPDPVVTEPPPATTTPPTTTTPTTTGSTAVSPTG